MLDKLKIFFDEMKEFRRKLKAVHSNTVGQKQIRNSAEAMGAQWCNNICPQLKASGGFESALLEKYTTQFSRLIKLSASPAASSPGVIESLSLRAAIA